MFRLIYSNFIRLRKDILFWICVVGMFVLGVTTSVDIYIDKKDSNEFCAENVAFGFTIVSGILCAVFCGMFQGEELSDRTIRNKIISGHKRSNIYLSQVLVCISAGIIMCIAYIIPSLIIGIIFMGGFKELNNIEIIGYYISGFLQVSVCISFFSLIIAAAQRKTLGISLCFFIAFLVIYLSMSIYQLLTIPEYTFLGETMEYGKNPRYPEENERKILTAVFEILPAGQAYQLCYRHAENLIYMISCDIMMCIFFIFSGISVFSRKDLK